ncbi:MAG: tRNA (N(6)-L-threonylcarbamoyladenosine(37)-C(2))-methylthiotransferase MtaB [Lachnospiraceae bacterium]|nr:tRNA (N(6)-L-threonylcarbamoyladenosine(37)-C(2))-methylthiotransferase MtaB [Lachnospiraceae bacterium]
MAIKVAFHNLGCKVNSYETQAMLAGLKKRGYVEVPFEEGADVYVINTCTVTNVADRKSRQMLHRAKAMNPDAAVVAVGCYVQAAGEKLLADEAVDIVIGNDRKHELPDLIEAWFDSREKKAALDDIGQSRRFEEMPAECSEHTRAFLKIEDGCNQFCSYCLIPYVRGRVRSRDPEDILAEARRLAEKGYSEIVLTGIHLSSFGLDFEGDAGMRAAGYGAPLLTLLQRLDEIPGIRRIRLGSLEPRLITPENAEALAGIRSLCPHFHLSLQSGCDETLRRMNRKYTAAEFAEKVRILRKAYDRPALTTDVIVGFPGETEEEFAATVAFLKEIRFAQTHIFRYSRRKGTVADRMPDQIPEPVKADRSNVLLRLNRENRRLYAESFIGDTREVLLETAEEGPDGPVWTGYTPEYLRLKLRCEDGRPGLYIPVKIEKDSLLLTEE